MSDPFASFEKNFGFGCMRLPMVGDDVDIPQTKQMVDAFLDAGFCYFGYQASKEAGNAGDENIGILIFHSMLIPLLKYMT